MVEYSEEERSLLNLLKAALPADFDTATNLYAKLAEQHRAYLERIASHYSWNGTSKEDVVSETIIKGYVTIAVQMGASEEYLSTDLPVKPTKNFKFEEDGGLGVREWLKKLMLGKFGKGGVTRTHNRRSKKLLEMEVEYPEGETIDFADPGNLDMEAEIDARTTGDKIDQMEASFNKLPPRQKFILVARFGLGVDEPFTSQNLAAKAKEFGLQEVRKISRRATHLGFSPEARKLKIQDIAIMLDISTKQVSRDMASSYKAIKNDLNEWRAVQ